MRLSELEKKDVVNIDTGERIGSIKDIDINDNGDIKSLIISSNTFRLFGNLDEMEVTFSEIVRIGEDVILIKNK